MLTARDQTAGRDAAARLAADGLPVEFARLDVTDPESIRAFVQDMERRFGRVDILVNNAGHIFESRKGVLDVSVEALQASMDLHVYGPLRLVQALFPLLKKAGDGARVVNVSSGMAQLHDMDGGWTPYRVSKTALNALTRVMADELAPHAIQVNVVCPGWVRTDMGGPNAPRSVQQGAEGIVWLALRPPGGPTGKFFRDGQEIDW